MSGSGYRHDDEVAGALAAAKVIVPAIREIVGPITSVVDLGGGTGAWLTVFEDAGVPDLVLVDVPEVRDNLLVRTARFEPANLNQGMPRLLRADLAICVECAEHLQSSRARALVEWLTNCADVVVFSAAVPGQGGKGHVNERPPAYWRALFAERGFARRDVLRPKILDRSAVPWWYRQNLFLFTKPAVALNCDHEFTLPDDFDLMHRPLVDEHCTPSFSHAARLFVVSFLRAVKRRLATAEG